MAQPRPEKSWKNGFLAANSLQKNKPLSQTNQTPLTPEFLANNHQFLNDTLSRSGLPQETQEVVLAMVDLSMRRNNRANAKSATPITLNHLKAALYEAEDALHSSITIGGVPVAGVTPDNKDKRVKQVKSVFADMRQMIANSLSQTELG